DLAGKTIRLNSALPAINKHFVRIEGVGLTLASNARPLLSIDSVSAHIRGIRFTPDAEGLGNETENLGGVVRNNGGDLTIHACIFSGNTSTTWEENGGALYNNAGGKMSVAACTFYNNAAFRGGAIYNAGELELLGNIFFGNQAPIPGNGKTLFNSDGTVTATYNLYDVDGAGYSFETDNTHSAAISFSPTTFEPTPDNLLSETFGPPSSYPEQDYYGESFEWSVFPGAVKRTHAEGRILLWESVGQGTVELVVGPVPDAVGLVPKGSVVIFHAIPQGAGDTRTFRWEVNGQQHAETGDLTLTIDTNTFVSAVFNRIYTVTTTEDSPQGGQGTLRNYLFSGWQGDGDIIRFADDLAGKTIVLSTNFPEITHQIIVEGNGITLDGSNLTAPMFNLVAGSSATFNRIRFTGVSLPESASESIGGAAFVNHGQLTLNNCIFDDNHAAGRLGGAVYNDNLLIINACTFCGNVAQAGGAIYAAAGVILTAGNVFYNNTAPTSPDICEVTPQRNNHRHDQYLADPILDMETFIPHDGGRFIPYAEMVSLFGFPSVDFYNTLRNTRTVTSAGAAVRPSVVSFETQYADVIPSRIVERGSFLDEPSPQPQRAGYLFVGWFEDLAGAYRWNFELRPTTMETLTLYARWQDLLTFPTVTFRFGNGKPDSITYPSPATSLVEPPADPSRPYYIFTGWFANEGCTVLWDFLTVVTANTTLYAGWKPRSFTVVFDPRDGSPPVSLETTYAAPLVPPAITPKGNSQVTGWLADTLSSVLWNFTTMRVTADMTLYAFWTPPLKSIAIPSSPSVSLTPTAFSETVRLRGACGRRIGVYTSSGRLILSRRLGTDDEFVNTSAFPSGLYFFVLSALDVKESVFFKAVKR
ncbi:MAG: InlB B-repeat-containing protein, partial [Tannerellaceae bacterium]|nr:InlB B-repeat-containing protein [Tannerellaceae bacterium]